MVMFYQRAVLLASDTVTGTKVPGTNFQLDPIRGAFNIGTMIRWLDYNDCWLAAECMLIFHTHRIQRVHVITDNVLVRCTNNSQ
jgi:hypothetical protein